MVILTEMTLLLVSTQDFLVTQSACACVCVTMRVKWWLIFLKAKIQIDEVTVIKQSRYIMKKSMPTVSQFDKCCSIVDRVIYFSFYYIEKRNMKYSVRSTVCMILNFWDSTCISGSGHGVFCTVLD